MCDYLNCIDRHVKALKALRDRVAEAIAVGSLPFSEWIESSLASMKALAFLSHIGYYRNNQP